MRLEKLALATFVALLLAGLPEFGCSAPKPAPPESPSAATTDPPAPKPESKTEAPQSPPPAPVEKPLPTPDLVKNSGCVELHHKSYLRTTPDGSVTASIPDGAIVSVSKHPDGRETVAYAGKTGFLQDSDLADATPSICVEYTVVPGEAPIAAEPPAEPAIGQDTPQAPAGAAPTKVPKSPKRVRQPVPVHHAVRRHNPTRAHRAKRR